MWEAEPLRKSCLAGHALTTMTHQVLGGRRGDAREEQLRKMGLKGGSNTFTDSLS